MHRRSVEIAGAGLGGLAAAVAFASRGWKTRVWEQAPQLREIGAGIYVWENGLRVLDALGVLDRALATAQPIHQFQVRDERLGLVEQFEYEHGPAERLFTMLRPTLHAALQEAAVSLGVTIEPGHKVVGAAPSGELHLGDGRSLRADLVVGADGIHSRVRDSVGLLRAKRTLRDGATRLLIPRTELECRGAKASRCVEYWSGTRRILYTPCHRDWIYLALCGRNDDIAARRVPVDQDAWVRSFPALEHYIRRITPETEARWDAFSMVRVSRWHAGRVAIVGDAVHAQPPNLGQGAGLAMANALALAVFADRYAGDLEHGLDQWEARERPLVAHTQRWTYLWGLISATCPRGLERLRSPFVSWVGKREAIRTRLAKTASHVPTGTPAPARTISPTST